MPSVRRPTAVDVSAAEVPPQADEQQGQGDQQGGRDEASSHGGSVRSFMAGGQAGWAGGAGRNGRGRCRRYRGAQGGGGGLSSGGSGATSRRRARSGAARRAARAKRGSVIPRGRSRSTSVSYAMTPSSITSTRSASSTRLLDVVGDQQYGAAASLPQLGHQALRLDPGERVERAERLVEQQQIGLAHQGAGQRGALGLAAGQRLGPRVRAMREPDLVQRPFGDAPVRACPGSPSSTLRHTRFHGMSRGAWNATALRRGTSTVPSISRSSPARMRSSVDLPQPLRPSSATNSPGLHVEIEPGR